MTVKEAPWGEIDKVLDEASGYDGTAEAALEAVVQAFEYAASRCGLTGFQAGWVMLTAYAKTMCIDGPIMVFRGENLLYPQYDLPGDLAKWMEECKPWLKEQAAAKLAERDDDGMVVDRVRDHWRKLAAWRV